MAELNITLRYKYLPARIVFIAMMALLPLWEVAAPMTVGSIIGQTMSYPGLVPFSRVIFEIPFLLLLIVLAISITGCAEDNRLHLSKDGISFPLFFLPKLKFRRAWQWTELSSADLFESLTDEKGVQKAGLLLSFGNNAQLRLDLSKFDRADLEQLLLGIEIWGTNCTRSAELVNYQNQVQNQNQAQDGNQPGYTQMWEEELSRRFQATAFVPLEPGHTLQNGKLKIQRQLAFGGLSAIYLAQENQLDLLVIKEAVVPPNAEPEVRAEAERHLVREAEILSRFSHPRAARVIDHFIEDGRHYLKLEYINGVDLRQYVKQNGVVPQEQAIKWGLQILEVLHALHTQNPPVLHRDLTPENLVLAKDEIMLIDFGAANEFVGAATGTIVGKQAYMPAEQLRGKSVVQSDLYAFAGTLHFLLTGKDPLPLSIARPKAILGTVDDELDEIIAKCSAFEPEDRYADAIELSQELTRLLEKLQVDESASERISISKTLEIRK